MDDASLNTNAGKWQQYKEWLIEQTAGTGYAADEEVLERFYGEASVPWGDTARCEARKWMKNPVVPGSLAVNRFGSDEEAYAFIENLYALGAEAVYVTNIDHRRINFDPVGPCADTLIVVLPDDPQQRRALLDTRAAEDYEAPPIADKGWKEIGFWWD
jgi:hypothetical protein